MVRLDAMEWEIVAGRRGYLSINRLIEDEVVVVGGGERGLMNQHFRHVARPGEWQATLPSCHSALSNHLRVNPGGRRSSGKGSGVDVWRCTLPARSFFKIDIWRRVRLCNHRPRLFCAKWNEYKDSRTTSWLQPMTEVIQITVTLKLQLLTGVIIGIDCCKVCTNPFMVLTI